MTWGQAGSIYTDKAAGTDFLMLTRVTGDADHRFRLSANGNIAWGDGTAAPTLILGKTTGANALTVQNNGQIRVLDDPQTGNDLARKFYVDNAISGAIAGSGAVTLTGTQTITGAKTFNAGTTFSGVTTFNTYLDFNDAAYIYAEKSAGGYALVQSKVDADVNLRYRLNVDGTMEWGAGASNTDVLLERGGPNYLQMGSGDSLRILQDPVNVNDVTTKGYVDTRVSTAIGAIDYSNYVTLNGDQTIDSVKTFTDHITMDGIGAYLELIDGSNIYVEGTMAGAQAFASAVAGDLGDNRFIINAGGLVQWGPGDDLVDTNLYRFSEGLLRTDGDLWVGQGLTVAGTGGISIGAAGDAILTRTGAGVIGVTGKIQQATVPTQNDDLVNKAYVDAQSQGLDQKASVRAASTTNLDLTGLETVDGVSLIAGDRILVMGQTAPEQNGIYVVAAGAWARSEDANTDEDVTAGLFTFVSEGVDNGNNGFVLITPDPVVLGTTELEFTQFSKAGEITAGDGLIKTGNIIDVQGTADRIAVNVDNIDIATTYAGQASIDTLGTVTTGTWNADVIDIAFGGTGAGSLAGAQSNLDIVTLSDNQTVTGVKTFSGSGGVEINSGGYLYVVGSTPYFEMGDPGNLALGINITGDLQERFAVLASGGLLWGSGAAGHDVRLDRVAANVISLDTGDYFRVQEDPLDNFDVVNKGYLDTTVSAISTELTNYVDLGSSQTITGAKTFMGSAVYLQDDAAGTIGLRTYETGAAFNHFTLGVNGDMSWGDGTAALDTQLVRSGSGQLSVYGEIGLYIDGNLAIGDGTGDPNEIVIRNPNAGNLIFRSLVQGDTWPKFSFTAEGEQMWGDGTVEGGDVSISRASEGVLFVGGQVQAYDATEANQLVTLSQLETAVGDVDLSGYAQLGATNTFTAFNVFETPNGSVETENYGLIVKYGTASEISIGALGNLMFELDGNTSILNSHLVGDSDQRFTIDSEGFMSWGSGASSADVFLSRQNAGELSIGGDLVVTGTIDGYVALTGSQTITGSKAFDGGITIYQNSFSMNDGFMQLDATPVYLNGISEGVDVITTNIVGGTATQYFALTTDGAMTWYDDTTSTTLARIAGQLNLNDDLVVQGNNIVFGQLSVDGVATFTETVNVLDKNIKFDNMFTDASPIIRADVTGEGNDRFVLQAGGRLQWGPGTAGTDIILERAGANALRLGAGDTLRVQQDPVVADDVTRKSYVDTAVAAAVSAATLSIQTVLDDTVLDADDEVVLVNHTGNGPVTITLPATHTAGQVIHIKDISGLAETDNITIDTSDADLIDGQNTASLVMNYQTISVVSNGTNWYII
jgi:hypothetical protein